jgi:hypothetical protein
MDDSQKQLKIREIPRSGLQDVALTTVKAALQFVPIVGGAAAELLGGLVAEPVAKRRDQFMQEVANGLSELEEKIDNFEVGKLSQNDAFVTAVMTTVHSVGRTHSEEKRVALKNAVLNSATAINLDSEVQAIFLDLVDRLTPLHLKLLTFFKNPSEWFNNENRSFNYESGGLNHVIEEAFPNLQNKKSVYGLVIQDLQNVGLAKNIDLGLNMTSSGLMASRTTEMGNQFLKFIESSI